MSRSDSAPTEKIIKQTDDVYRPSPEAFEVDVWEFDRLISQAAEGGGAEELESATSLYREELLKAAYYSWAEPMQRHFSRSFLDALVNLSDERLEQGDNAGALGALRQAIDANPQGEYLYRRRWKSSGGSDAPTTFVARILSWRLLSRRSKQSPTMKQQSFAGACWMGLGKNRLQ